MVLNTADNHTKVTTLLSDLNTHEALRGEPTSRYKKKSTESLQQLEKKETTERQLYDRLSPGDTILCMYGLHKEGAPLRSNQQHQLADIQHHQSWSHHPSSIGWQHS